MTWQGMLKMNSRAARAIAGVLLAAGIALLLGGCSVEQLVKGEGEYTCAECHTDRTLLKADLAANPLPKKVASESEGEG